MKWQPCDFDALMFCRPLKTLEPLERRWQMFIICSNSHIKLYKWTDSSVQASHKLGDERQLLVYLPVCSNTKHHRNGINVACWCQTRHKIRSMTFCGKTKTTLINKERLIRKTKKKSFRCNGPHKVFLFMYTSVCL